MLYLSVLSHILLFFGALSISCSYFISSSNILLKPSRWQHQHRKLYATQEDSNVKESKISQEDEGYFEIEKKEIYARNKEITEVYEGAQYESEWFDIDWELEKARRIIEGTLYISYFDSNKRKMNKYKFYDKIYCIYHAPSQALPLLLCE